MSSPLPRSSSISPSRDASAALVFDDVAKSYRRGPHVVPALRGVSLTLAGGSSTAIMGPSGSGKSTLLNCGAGLDVPTSGRVVVGGTDLSGMSSTALTRFRRDRIGFVFQAYNLVPQLSVVDNINLPLLLAGRTADPTWHAELLQAVGLQELQSRLPGELSGGQAQRVAIARALLTRPAVVFADEPTGALDTHTGSQVLQLLRHAAAALGQTVVIVTHDPAVAASADTVLFLVDGQLVGQLDGSGPAQIAARMTQLGGR